MKNHIDLFHDRSGLPSKALTEDDADRISLCLKVLSDQPAPAETLVEVFDKECRIALGGMLEAQVRRSWQYHYCTRMS